MGAPGREQEGGQGEFREEAHRLVLCRLWMCGLASPYRLDHVALAFEDSGGRLPVPGVPPSPSRACLQGVLLFSASGRGTMAAPSTQTQKSSTRQLLFIKYLFCPASGLRRSSVGPFQIAFLSSRL